MRAYKLLRQMKSGALRSLYIDNRVDRPLGQWMQAEYHPTKGFAPRKGWHCTFVPLAPHLSKKNRVWAEVELDGVLETHERPECQGGQWLLCIGQMKITRTLSDEEVLLVIEEAEGGKRGI